MSVYINNFMQGRHRLQVFPSASWSVQYCPCWPCLDVSSCFSLLWTSVFWMSTIGLPMLILFTMFVPSRIVARQFGSCMLLYKISPPSCLHDKFSVVVHTSSPAAHIVHCCCFFLWSKVCFHWKTLRILHNMIACYNINCYSTFRTEHGLHQHLFHNAGCQQYINHKGMHLNGSVNGSEVGEGQAPLLRRRASYGVECMRLNRMMNAVVVPIYPPFEEFDFGAANNLFEVADIVTMDSSDD